MNLQKTLALNKYLPKRYQALVRPATFADAACLAPRLRAIDCAEIAAHSGMSAAAALTYGIEVSEMAWAFLHPKTGTVAVIAGLNMNSQPPAPWASSTDFDFALARFFVNVSHCVIAYMFNFASELTNMVDADNAATLKWLKWEGFRVYQPEIFGVKARHFQRFVATKEDFKNV